MANRCAILDFLSGAAVSMPQGSLPEDIRVMREALLNLQNGGRTLHCGQAGTVMRFLTALLSVTPGEWILTGAERILQRPVGPLVRALQELGADIVYLKEEGFPPLKISGKHLEGGRVEIPGNVSSQFISALMMTGATMPQGLLISITPPVHSRPYIDMTLFLMRQYGIQAKWEDDASLSIPNMPYKKPELLAIEADWSAAACWYETIALSRDPDAQILLPGLSLESIQGDRAAADIFKELGVDTQEEGRCLLIRKGSQSSPPILEKDLSATPDLAQALAATCCALGVPFRFHGLSSLTIKETDRAGAMKEECAKLGFMLQFDAGTLSWDGAKRPMSPEPVIKAHGDHRMVLSMAPLSIACPGLVMEDPLAVTKSYPDFFDSFRQAGFQIENI